MTRRLIAFCVLAVTAAFSVLASPAPWVQGQDLVPVAEKDAPKWNDIEELPAPLTSTAQEPGTTSFGQPELIQQRYPDGRIQLKRSVVQDAEGNFVHDGAWQLFNRNGQIIAEGQYDRGSMVGAWRRWHPIGSDGIFSETPFTEFQGPFLSVASFVDGRLSGVWTIFDRRERKIFEIPYQDGQRHGIAIWYWPSGAKMRQVGFQNGTLDGEVLEWNREDQVTRRATYRDGKELIIRTSWYGRNQKESEERFLGAELEIAGQDDWWNAQLASYDTIGQELQHGLTEAWYPNGQLRSRGEYHLGETHREFISWHDNGQKQIHGQFENGNKVGQWTWWHLNGKKAVQGRYQDDFPVGPWTWWNAQGEVTGDEQFSETPGTTESLEVIDGAELLPPGN